MKRIIRKRREDGRRGKVQEKLGRSILAKVVNDFHVLRHHIIK